MVVYTEDDTLLIKKRQIRKKTLFYLFYKNSYVINYKVYTFTVLNIISELLLKSIYQKRKIFLIHKRFISHAKIPLFQASISISNGRISKNFYGQRIILS